MSRAPVASRTCRARICAHGRPSRRSRRSGRQALRSAVTAGQDGDAVARQVLALAREDLGAGDAVGEEGNVVAGGDGGRARRAGIRHEDAAAEAREVECRRQPGRPAADHKAIQDVSASLRHRASFLCPPPCPAEANARAERRPMPRGQNPVGQRCCAGGRVRGPGRDGGGNRRGLRVQRRRAARGDILARWRRKRGGGRATRRGVRPSPSGCARGRTAPHGKPSTWTKGKRARLRNSATACSASVRTVLRG